MSLQPANKLHMLFQQAQLFMQELQTLLSGLASNLQNSNVAKLSHQHLLLAAQALRSQRWQLVHVWPAVTFVGAYVVVDIVKRLLHRDAKPPRTGMQLCMLAVLALLAVLCDTVGQSSPQYRTATTLATAAACLAWTLTWRQSAKQAWAKTAHEVPPQRTRSKRGSQLNTPLEVPNTPPSVPCTPRGNGRAEGFEWDVKPMAGSRSVPVLQSPILSEPSSALAPTSSLRAFQQELARRHATPSVPYALRGAADRQTDRQQDIAGPSGYASPSGAASVSSPPSTSRTSHTWESKSSNMQQSQLPNHLPNQLPNQLPRQLQKEFEAASLEMALKQRESVKLQRRVDLLESQVVNMENTLAMLRRSTERELKLLKQVRKEAAGSRSEAERAADDLHQLQAEVDRTSQALQERVSAVSALEVQLERGSRQLEELQAVIAHSEERQKQRLQAQATLDGLDRTIMQRRQQLKDAEDALVALTMQREQDERQLTTLRGALRDFAATKALHVQQIAILTAELQQLQQHAMRRPVDISSQSNSANSSIHAVGQGPNGVPQGPPARALRAYSYPTAHARQPLTLAQRLASLSAVTPSPQGPAGPKGPLEGPSKTDSEQFEPMPPREPVPMMSHIIRVGSQSASLTEDEQSVASISRSSPTAPFKEPAGPLTGPPTGPSTGLERLTEEPFIHTQTAFSGESILLPTDAAQDAKAVGPAVQQSNAKDQHVAASTTATNSSGELAQQRSSSGETQRTTSTGSRGSKQYLPSNLRARLLSLAESREGSVSGVLGLALGVHQGLGLGGDEGLAPVTPGVGTDRETVGQADRQTDGQMDGQMDGQILAAASEAGTGDVIEKSGYKLSSGSVSGNAGLGATKRGSETAVGDKRIS